MTRHTPVLLAETIAALNLKPGMTVADCTLGDAGHSQAILEAIGPTGKLIGLDADAEAILRAKQFLHERENQIVFIRDNFTNLKKVLADANIKKVDALLFDLGWSTPQFSERGRGFSFLKDEPLDMRYNNGSGQTAAQLISHSSLSELAKILHLYGEEKFASQIAEAIVERQKRQPIERTTDLNQIILDVYRQKLNSKADVPWVGGHHPATQTYQALRMAVNQELEVVEQALPQALSVLQPGGRLAVITFHSVEDRLVKQYFKKIENKEIMLISKKPIVPGGAELGANPSARSAKLRVIEKI